MLDNCLSCFPDFLSQNCQPQSRVVILIAELFVLSASFHPNFHYNAGRIYLWHQYPL